MKNYWLGSLFQRNAHSLGRRLYFGALARFSAVFSKRQSVHFVRINGRTYKRVVLGDSHEAEAVERALLAAPEQAWFPPLIHRHENELLLGFIEGRRFEPRRSDDREALTSFLGALYSMPRRVDSSGTLRHRFEIDIEFLHGAGLIDSRLEHALRDRADSVQPEEVEMGLDYTDPVAKNFVVADGRLFAIDVESLRQDIPIGTSIAKACVHWLDRSDLGSMLTTVERLAGAGVTAQFPFVELCFRAGWAKRKLLQGKHRSLRTGLLRDLLTEV